MSKNKLMWNIALILIALISLPIAYAQFIPSGSKLVFVLINAAVIFVVLFILQSFLIPQKANKEKTSVWVIILLASLLVAFLYGQNELLWKGPLGAIFNIYVLVNSGIIAGVLYFALGLMKVNEKLKSAEGNAGYGILIFLFSVMITINIAPNMFLWKQEFVRTAFAFLFSAERGILNPKSGLLVFVTSFILISFFFTNFLLKQGNKTLNYALALIFAVNLAMPPVNPIRDVIQMGEIMFILILQETLKTSVPNDKPWASFLLAILLVGWASAALTINTPENRGAVAGMICRTPLINCKAEAGAAAVASSGFFSTSKTTLFVILGILLAVWLFSPAGKDGKTFSGWGIGIGLVALILLYMFGSGGGVIGKIGIGLLIIGAAIAAILYGMGRGENRRRILTLVLGGLKERWNAITKNARFLRDTPEGREPQVFRENRTLLHALVNFTTRSEITYRYWGFVGQGKTVGDQVLNKMGVFGYDQKTLRQDIIKARSGGVTSQGAHLDGWNKLNLDVIDLVNEFLELTYWIHVEVLFGFKEPTDHRDETIQYNEMIDKAQGLLTRIETSRKNYKLMTTAFGGHHVLNAYKGIILNMTNVTGDILEHPQKFARPGAVFIGNDNKPRDDKSEYYGDSFEAGYKIDVKGLKVPIHEVNQYGEYVQDIVDQKDASGDLPSDPRNYKKSRKVKPNDIIDYTDYSALMSNVELDWQGLAEDIRYGIWHPHSRTYQMYKKALANAIYPDWADDQIPIDKILTSPVSGDEAVDLRALANPGKNDYWGRITFDAGEPPKKDDPKHNPFPGLSALGMKKYMQERVRLDMKDKAKAAYFMSTIPADTAATKKVVKGKTVEVPIGGRLSEGVEEASKPS